MSAAVGRFGTRGHVSLWLRHTVRLRGGTHRTGQRADGPRLARGGSGKSRPCVVIKPNFAEAHDNFGEVSHLGRLDDAETSLRIALGIRPDFARAYTGLLFTLSHNEATGPEKLRAEHCRFGAQFEALPGGDRPRHVNAPDPERRLRIGFVSADLRNHPVASFFEPLLTQLAGHSTLALHAYYNYGIEDSVTPRLRRHFNRWTPTVTFSDALSRRESERTVSTFLSISPGTRPEIACDVRMEAGARAGELDWLSRHHRPAQHGLLLRRSSLSALRNSPASSPKTRHLPATAPFLPAPRRRRSMDCLPLPTDTSRSVASTA